MYIVCGTVKAARQRHCRRKKGELPCSKPGISASKLELMIVRPRIIVLPLAPCHFPRYIPPLVVRVVRLRFVQRPRCSSTVAQRLRGDSAKTHGQ